MRYFWTISLLTVLFGCSLHVSKPTRSTGLILDVKASKTCQILRRMARYEINISNPCETSSHSFSVTMTIPDNSVYGQSNPRGTITSNQLVWSLPPLAPKEMKKLTVFLAPNSLGTLESQISLKEKDRTPINVTRKVVSEDIPPVVLLAVMDLNDPVNRNLVPVRANT